MFYYLNACNFYIYAPLAYKQVLIVLLVKEILEL